MENWRIQIETHPVREATPEEYKEELRVLKEMIAESDIENRFEFEELDPNSAEILREQYEEIIMSPEKSLGAGNNGAVFSIFEGVDECIKMRWETLSVNNRSKRFSALPPTLQRRKRIAEHFELATSARRQFAAQGADFIPQNNYLAEAAMTRAAHLAGLAFRGDDSERLGTPRTSELIRLTHEDEGFCDVAQKDPYLMTEEVYMLYLEQIRGLSLEDMIYEQVDWIHSVEIEKVEKELFRILETLHKADIVHRDITIRNVMIEEATGLPRLIDFGTATFTTPATDGELKAEDLEQARKIIDHLKNFKEDPIGYKAKIVARHNALTSKFI